MTKEESLIADKIKTLRKWKRLTQKGFAAKLKMSYAAYTYLECKKTAFDIKTLNAVSKLFQIDIAAIIDNQIDLQAFEKILKS